MARPVDPRFIAIDGRVLRGVRRVVPVPASALGVEWSAVVPGGRMWRVIGGVASLVTSAAVANRIGGVQLAAEGAVFYSNINTTSITASQTQVINYQVGTTWRPASGAAGFQAVQMPWLFLQPGDSIGSLTGSMQAGDQYAGISLYVEEVFADSTKLTMEYQHAADLIGDGVLDAGDYVSSLPELVERGPRG